MSKSRARYTTAGLLEGSDALSALIKSTAWALEGASVGRELPAKSESRAIRRSPEDGFTTVVGEIARRRS